MAPKAHNESTHSLHKPSKVAEAFEKCRTFTKLDIEMQPTFVQSLKELTNYEL